MPACCSAFECAADRQFNEKNVRAGIDRRRVLLGRKPLTSTAEVFTRRLAL